MTKVIPNEEIKGAIVARGDGFYFSCGSCGKILDQSMAVISEDSHKRHKICRRCFTLNELPFNHG